VVVYLLDGKAIIRRSNKKETGPGRSKKEIRKFWKVSNGGVYAVEALLTTLSGSEGEGRDPLEIDRGCVWISRLFASSPYRTNGA
jgi:hypothetical protein